jgi:hypothetical protein
MATLVVSEGKKIYYESYKGSLRLPEIVIMEWRTDIGLQYKSQNTPAHLRPDASCPGSRH